MELMLFKMLPPTLVHLIAPCALILIGWILEKKLVGRVATFSNVMAANVYFYYSSSIHPILAIYLTAGFIFVIIEFLPSGFRGPLSRPYSIVRYAYSSIVVSALILFSVESMI
ncbi:MAG: hypothetical protein PHS47_03545 [Methanocellales archaeon]|nr:hypothetical protein [Methanocellales archaeon]MDD3421357.1 hypothetical protein [Methanocellales archaeon]MDD4898778.1 hypothetical protein [Methanocellales archaeon]MDD5446921.1 hypothetical protein [Methanocellales archaeon]